MLARGNEVLQSGDGQAWAKFAAVTVFAGDCIVLPAGASVVGPLEDFWGRALRIHRKDDEASYFANPDEFILVSGAVRRRAWRGQAFTKLSRRRGTTCPIGLVLTLP
jgi:hypothetical protein